MAEKNTKPVQGPGGRGPKDPRPKVENPGKLFMRLLAYIMKNYAVHCILVVICIFITVLGQCTGYLVYADSDRRLYPAAHRSGRS